MQRLHDDSSRMLGYIEGLLSYKNTQNFVLLNPGPVMTTPKVKAALIHHDMCHRDEDFSDLVRNLRIKLKKVFKGNENHEVVIITGSGTSGIEATIASTVPRDKKVLVIVNGAFGERYVEVANVHDMDIVELNFGWKNTVDVQAVEDAIAADPEIACVMMAHHETSTGILNPIHEIGEICHRYNRIFMVDAVSSLGAEELDVVEDHIDVCLSSANKAIHAIAGVAFVCISNRAWEVINNNKPRLYYLDLRRYRKYAVSIEQTPFTPAVSNFFALDAAVDELLETTVEGRWAIYRERNEYIRENFRGMGLSFLTQTGSESHGVTVIEVPEYIKFSHLYNTMKSFGFIIYGCKDELEDKYFQISNMGDLPRETIDTFLNTLRFVLLKSKSEYTGSVEEFSSAIISAVEK
ncbi:alanine--glyoxylate aminotransferase family protein [Myxococcota bacterium]|nr:alanine--glyoxylate aminotransferase family protein [Myxococcota bacterium]MBU1379805.1 alanine--glyoxylate aminotransferase family protein [Myxococcota bacterium]MBU1497127.1 alanine--glyoxylate aminotransferase family protein [Myxococcota bacterium]